MSNKQVDWFGVDSYELMEYNLKNKKQILSANGWINYTPFTYSFNEHGFRCNNFPADNSVMFLGCSHTFGLGVPLEETWAHKVANACGLSNVNLGWPGSSNDTVFRTAYHYIPKIKPKLVIMLAPESSRTDIVINDASLLTFLPSKIVADVTDTDFKETIYDKFYEAWISSDANIELNKLKNILAIKQMCVEHCIKFVSIDATDIKRIDFARDLLHYGVRSHDRIAKTFLTFI